MADNVISFDRPAAYWLEKAHRCGRQSEWMQAVRFYRLALEKDMTPETLTELAWAYIHLECYEAADRLCFQSLLMDPDYGETLYAVGMSAFYQEQEDLCMNALDKFLRLCPHHPQAQNVHDLLAETPWRPPYEPHKRGWRADTLCRMAQRCTDAKKRDRLLKKAIRVDPTGESYLTLSVFRMMLSPKEAWLWWKKARAKGVSKEKKLPLFLTGALLQSLLNQPDACRKFLKKALPLCRTADETEWFLATCLDCRMPLMVQTVCLKQLKKAPFCISAMHAMRLSCVIKGDHKGAEKWYKRILAVDPQDASLSDCKDVCAPYSPRFRRLVRSALSLMSIRDERLRPGVLNRLTHVTCLALRDTLTTEDVFHFLPPMYRALRPLTRQHIEGKAWGPWHTAFTLCLLRTRYEHDYARKLFSAAPYKKRILRCMRRIERGMASMPGPRVIK